VTGDTRPEQGLFFRSDHFPLAKIGIPAVSLKSGDEFVGRPAGWGAEQFRAYNAANYHQPSDEYRETWDLAGMIEEIEIALAIGHRVADAPEMPRYNQGDEFAKARK
jgi:Zn-dependent M28 family amino/carboxypeptidase